MCSFNEFIQQSTASKKFIAHCYGQDKQLLQQGYQKSSDAVILIGPEGDFSPEEVQKAIQHHYQPVSLGNSRLRTETAGIAACHTISVINEN